ncbi:MAG: biotin--[acetyl-CoA-carboxylase] ligase [Lachnospiraceae bacterium]|nr:biotin--[acetyl-CoA-carboxylase] ligase [Lachnospiraceae bacterium]
MARITVKNQVLNILHKHKGTYYSGQELAEELDVSRTAVWKAINKLREEGYSIEGSTKLGYAMADDTDILNVDEIYDNLDKDAKTFYKIECKDVVDSTNNICRTLGDAGEVEGRCVVASKQTAGKGRRGRKFESPDTTGVYLSVLLRPDMPISDSVHITTAAAVAAAKACEMIDDNIKEKDVDIKWVNDLFIRGKKFAGILTEASVSMETGRLDYAVLGIGFNLAAPKDGWPEELKDIAGSLFEDEYPNGTRNRLVAAFLEEFYQVYKKLPDVTYLDEYRSRQMAIGKEIKVIEADGTFRKAKAIDVDDNCHLVVLFEGETETKAIDSGEISIRF